MFKHWLMGSSVLRGPENDQGGGQGGDDDDQFQDDAGDLGVEDDDGGLDGADDGDQGGGDDDGDRGQDDDGGEGAPAPRGRSNETVRALRERAQRAERERDELRQTRELVDRRQPAPDPAAEEAAFQARIADLPFDQQLAAVRERERALVSREFNNVNLRIAQSEDRSEFNALASSNPVAKRHAAAVEAEFRAYQQRGQFVKREIILKNILGDLALKRGPAAVRRDTNRGRDNLAREAGRGGSRRSDVQGGNRPDPNSLEAIERRLTGVTLDQI